MAQEQVQIQTQKQQQVQRLSQQQMLQVKLLEMPLTELEECVNAELDDNPALERGGEETDDIDTGDAAEQTEDDDFDTQQEREERQDALDSALERMKSDDDIPTYDSRQQRNNADYEEIVYGDTSSTNRWARENLPAGRGTSWNILSAVWTMTDSCGRTSAASAMSWLSTMA